MKHSPFTDCLIFLCVIFVVAGCNLFSSVKPADTSPATEAVKVDTTEVPLPDTPLPPPPPGKSKLRAGQYRATVDTISDQFLEDYQVIGGVPPLSWWSSYISVTIGQDGSITAGVASFWIGTDTKTSLACTRGEYDFSADTVTGSYDQTANIMTVDMTGEERYAPISAGPNCSGAGLVQQGTKRFTFAVNEKGQIVLCKPGETGDTCLNNPMALLK